MENSCSPAEMVEFLFHLEEATFAILKARERELRQFGISRVQCKVLLAMKGLDYEPSLGELSAALFREHNSVSDITRRMEEKGLIKKYRDPVKKTTTRIALTELGEQVYSRILERRFIYNILSILSLEDCRKFVPVLRKLLDRANAEANIKYKPDYETISRTWRELE